MICITDTSLRHGGGYTTLCVYLFRIANCGVNCVYNSYSLQCFSLSLLAGCRAKCRILCERISMLLQQLRMDKVQGLIPISATAS